MYWNPQPSLAIQPHHIFYYYVIFGRMCKAIRPIRSASVSMIFTSLNSLSFYTGVKRVCWEAPIPHTQHTTPTAKSTQPLCSRGFKLSQTPPLLLPPQFTYRFLHLPKTRPHTLLPSSTHRHATISRLSHQQHWMWPRQYKQHCTDLTDQRNQKHFDIFNVDDIF